ncbi:hypothetical protein [Halorubrum spindle-shaped virus-BLv25]|nr:hypothetical protein [Halorubrum spindle-shaped virus-BLv25]
MNVKTEYTIQGRTGKETTTDERKAYAASKSGYTVTAEIKA